MSSPQGVAPSPADADARGTADRGTTGRGTDALVSGNETWSPSQPEVMDFSGYEPDIDLGIDVVSEEEAHPRGTEEVAVHVLLGEQMVRIMTGWMADRLTYPSTKKDDNESGIGPENEPGTGCVFIGGASYPASTFRSCSPTTFRAFMAALGDTLPDGRSLRHDKSNQREIQRFYKIWNVFDSVYKDIPYPARRGAGEVLGALGLGRELAFGHDIKQISDLRRGDILQTWSRTVETETAKDGTTKSVAKWPGHSMIIYDMKNGVRVISANIPVHSEAIKIQLKKSLGAAIERMIRGAPVPAKGYQSVYVVRTTHYVTTFRAK